MTVGAKKKIKKKDHLLACKSLWTLQLWKELTYIENFQLSSAGIENGLSPIQGYCSQTTF